MVSIQNGDNNTIPKRGGTPASWKPGQCGNPGGRPAGVGDIRRLAREHTAVAVTALVEIVKDKTATPAARVAAANAILDRGYGRPLQQVEVGSAGAFTKMTDEQLDSFVVEKMAAFNSVHQAPCSAN